MESKYGHCSQWASTRDALGKGTILWFTTSMLLRDGSSRAFPNFDLLHLCHYGMVPAEPSPTLIYYIYATTRWFQQSLPQLWFTTSMPLRDGSSRAFPNLNFELSMLNSQARYCSLSFAEIYRLNIFIMLLYENACLYAEKSFVYGRLI